MVLPAKPIRLVPHLKDALNTTFSFTHNVEHRH